MSKPKPIPKLTPKQIERFWSEVDRRGPTECWEWRRDRGSYEYGYTPLSPYNRFLVHRVAYMLGHGRDPGEFLVCHKCDNTRCCNPTHLFLGTDADNLADMRAKGRGAIGERSPRAKLMEKQVLEILNSDELPRVLAERYGVGAATIRAIRRGEIWKHIGDRSNIIHGPRCGERCPSSKLTENNVRQIRKSRKTVNDLAGEYGVAPSTIRGVLNGRTWATVA